MNNITPYEDRSLDSPRSFTSERGVTIEALIQAWLHAKEENLSHSAKTRTAYETTINSFRSLLQGNGYDLIWKGEDFVPMVADFAQAFASRRSEQSRRQGRVTPATQNQRLAILSSFYLYAIKRRHIITGNPIDSVDRPSIEAYARAQSIEQEEIVKRLQAIDVSTLQGARDLAILSVLLSTGRRVSEVANLTRKDVQVSGNLVKLSFHGKGDKAIRDTLSVEVSMLLVRWLSLFYPGKFLMLSDDTPLWVNVHHASHRGKKLGYHGFAGICKHYLGTSKVHTTRHTFAILMEVAGAKLTDIQQRLGHKNAATTGIYMDKLKQDKNVYSSKITELLGLKQEGEKS